MGSVNSARKKALYPYPQVKTDYGVIEGRRAYIYKDQIGDIYLGIPYAKPPIGDRRFQKPESPDPWGDRILHCKSYRPISIQKQVPIILFKTSEDCLYLNIVVPNWKCDSKDGFPVMIYIHGGGFVMDSGAAYNYKKVGRSLVRHGVITVTFSYRLGLLGYLCTNDDTCMGNFGLWDQYYALKFIYENIKHFGGNPDNITVFGQSAGGVSTDLLSMLPVSRHMVNKVGILGGSCETVWSVANKSYAASQCYRLIKKMGYKKKSEGEVWTKQDNEELMKYLRKLPASKFGLTMFIAQEIYLQMTLQVMPNVDGDLIPKAPYLLREESPPRPIICGNTLHEGLIFLLGRRLANLRMMKELESRFDRFNEIMINIFEAPEISMADYKKLYGVTELSLKDKKFRQKTIVQILDDNVNNFALHNFCQSERLKGSTVWTYIFEHHNNNILSGANTILPFSAATHGTELVYLLDHNIFLIPFKKTKTDNLVSDIFTKLYTNFAKYGDPNGRNNESPLPFHWGNITEDNPETYLRILPEPILVDQIENRRHETLSKITSNLNKYFTDIDYYKEGKYNLSL